MTVQPPQLGALGELPAAAVIEQLVAQATVGVGVVDLDLRYLLLNETLAAMNGVPVENHIGRTVREVLPEAADYLEPLLRGALMGTSLADMEFSYLDEGLERRFRGSCLSLTDSDGAAVAVLSLVVEITGHTRAEAALRVSQERLRLALEGTGTGTFEWDIQRDVLEWSPTMGALWGRESGWQPNSYREYVETLHPEDRDALAAEVRRATTEGVGYEREFRVIRPDGTPRWMHSRVHVVRGEDGRPETLVGLVSDIDQRRRRELSSQYLASVSLALGQSLDVEKTLQEVADRSVPSLADWCAVHIAQEGAAPQQVAVAHTDPALLAEVLELQQRWPPRADAPTGAANVVRTGQSEFYPSIPPEILRISAQDEDHYRLLERLQLRSALVVPLVARGRALGAITFVYAESGRVYDEEDLALAEELGRRAGMALDNARLHRAEAAAHRRLRRLEAVTDVALGHLELKELLNQLLLRLREVLEGDFAVVLLLDESREVLRVEAAVGLEADEVAGVRVPVGKGVAGRIAASGKALILDDVKAAEPVSPYLQRSARSLAGVPLRVEEQVIGVVHVSSKTERSFDDEDLLLLELVAERAARAISLARLYEQARDISATLQRSLLPSDPIAIEGLEVAVRYLPGQRGTEVGGDWYDGFRLPEGRCALAVGDVVGRGITAAAGMGQLRAAVRAYVHDRLRPAEAVSLLDNLVNGLGEVSFATLALVVADPRTGEASVCLAGHLPPVVRSASGTRLMDIKAGVPLGVPPGPREEHAFALRSGDVALLYTDGLVERRGVPIDQRLALLAETVANGPPDPEALVDHVLDRLLHLEGEDDVALLAVRRS